MYIYLYNITFILIELIKKITSLIKTHPLLKIVRGSLVELPTPAAISTI
jgi:hypothetical protein